MARFTAARQRQQRRLVLLAAIPAAASALSALTHGQLHVQHDFIPPHLVRALRTDSEWLWGNGHFKPSGLSNAAVSTNRFGEGDRQVCTPSAWLGGDVIARATLVKNLEKLRARLQAESTGRGRLDVAELYLSAHPPGAGLPLHMDERHEEAKGVRGWRTPTRRSVSWLLYLSADGWDSTAVGAGAGGALRAYVRPGTRPGGPGGAHEGNLQVGWRRADDGLLDAVYLDCWVEAPASPSGCASGLYAVVPSSGRRRWLCETFDSAASNSLADRVYERALPPGEAARFARIELAGGSDGMQAAVARGAMEAVDVSPQGGTLVVFDSVAVPHEVLPTSAGQRWAVAGWMHEPQQPFPKWFGRA